MWSYYFDKEDIGGDKHNYCRDPDNGNGGNLWCPTVEYSFQKYYYYDSDGYGSDYYSIYGEYENCLPVGAENPIARRVDFFPERDIGSEFRIVQEFQLSQI